MQTRADGKWARHSRNVASITALVLVACGGGGEQLGGIQGSGKASPATVVGPITGFGSIFVNGVEYATSSAQIRIDGQAGTEAQLRVGQIVTLKGTLNDDGRSGSASEVTFTGDAQGPVTALDVAGATFLVVGQRVRVTPETLFDETIQPADIEGLQNGTVVQVSGFANVDGDLVASRIDVESPAAPLQVAGTVAALDTAAQTFRIGAVTVDYSGTSPAGTLLNGATASVQGTLLSANGPLRATSVQVSTAAAGANSDVGEIEGFITAFTSATDFVVEGQRVTTDAGTAFVPAGLALGPNLAVKVEGTFNASGVLVADKLEQKRLADGSIRGLVDAVSSANNSITVLGVAVTTTATTAFEDKSNQKLRPFRLSDVRVGDFLNVRGSQNPGGAGLTATVVERETAQATLWLQGVATDVASPNLKVLGVSAMTNAQTQFIGLGNPQEAGDRFFAEASNQVVKLRGAVSGGVFIVDRAQILR